MTSATTLPAFTTKQRVLLALTAPLVPLFFCVAAGVAAMRQHNPGFHNHDTAAMMPQPADFGVTVAVALALVPLRALLVDRFSPIARMALPPATRSIEFRVNRFATSVFKLLYFSSMVGLGFWIQQDEPWFPASLGGSGNASLAFAFVAQPPTDAVKLYMRVEMAYLAHNLLFVLCCKPFDGDTMDYVIHDLTGMLLIGSSYLVNYIAMAATIALLNDVADVVHYLYLMATDSRRLWIVAPIMAVFLIGWGYTRLYVFPRDCLLVTVVDAPRLDRHVSSLYLVPTTLLLTLLLGLQVYWYQMLAGKGLRVLVKTTEPNQNAVIALKASD